MSQIYEIKRVLLEDGSRGCHCCVFRHKYALCVKISCNNAYFIGLDENGEEVKEDSGGEI
jgi:hypothetical protein